MTAAGAVPQRLPLSGWLRIALRIGGMVALLLACVPLYYLWKAARRPHNPWPRAFLAGIARLAGVRIAVEGQRAPGGLFLLANHVSWIDIPAISAATGPPSSPMTGWPPCRCCAGCAR